MTQAAPSVSGSLSTSRKTEPLGRRGRETVRAGSHWDPLDPVFRLGHRASRLGMTIGLLCAVSLHGGGVAAGMTQPLAIGGFAEQVRQSLLERLRGTYDVEVEKAPPPPPPPTADPPKPEPEAFRPLPATPAPAPKAPTPTPAAAEAGKVLTAQADPDEPLDLTGNTFVTGSGDRYVGGTTTADGTAQKAVYDPRARGAGVPDAPKAAPAVAMPAKDLSRSPVPVERSWPDCGFPPEADAEQIDYMQVRIIVTVGPDGRATSVSVLRDPGYGFGARARQCALRKRYVPGLDASGRSMTMTTAPFPVTFSR
jgi:protein TonB